MKAVHLVRYGDSDKAFELREISEPVISKPQQIKIKVNAFGLNFADVMARRGLYEDAPPLPAILGYDIAGIVQEVSEDIDHIQVGDAVFAMTRFGGYAESVIADAAGVAKIPAGLSFEEATSLATQAGTAYFCAYESVSLHKNDLVLIHAAAGGVGSALVQIVKNIGCKVIGTASTKKQDFLKEQGVDLAIDYTSKDFAAVIQDAYGNHTIDVVFDSIGGSTFKKGFKLLAPGGRIVTYGAASQISGSRTSKLDGLKVAFGFGLFSPIQLLMNSRAIIGVNMLRIADHRPHILQLCMEGVSQLAEKGIIKPVLGKVFDVKDIGAAHDYLESRNSVGKVAVVF